MECNKDEALRAKGIAEKKMESNDFFGAHKIAVKAQRLYPELENINQMICVCDVHCSAENKKYGNEKDWYDILQVEQSADEVSIKKQYRKLALLLHPDKNKFAGAEAAFMLIGEAQKVLLDREKRSFFDARYKRFFQNTAPNPPQENRSAKNVKPPSCQNNMNKNGISNVKKQPQQQAHPTVSVGTETFWTICPFCSSRYHYYKSALNKNLLCQHCKKNFIAYDIYAQSTPPGSYANQSDTNAQAGVSSQGVRCNASKGKLQPNSGQQPSGSNANKTAACARGVSSQGGSCSAFNGRFQGNSGQQKTGENAFANSGLNAQVGGSNKTNELNMGAKNRASSGGSNHPSTNIGKREKQTAVEQEGVVTGKREKEVGDSFPQSCGSFQSKGTTGKKQVVGSFPQSSSSFQSKGTTGNGDAAVGKEGGAIAGSKCGGDVDNLRSSLSKRHISCTEIGNDGETSNSSKRFKGNAQSPSPTKKSPSKVASTNITKPPGIADEVEKSAKDNPNEKDSVKDNDLQRSCKDDQSDSSFNASPKEAADVPDSDFNDFDQIRNKNKFKVNQIWAVYDTVDAMPRFYAQIRKVLSSGLLRITWLEPDPDEEDVLRWVDNDLPFSCGKFRPGATDNTEDILMFSQPMCWEKGHGKKGCIKIYPKKDEIWALFRDWHRDWMSNPQNHKKFEFEFVEILSDYNESAGVRAAFLGKIKGFSCVFCRKGKDEIHIPPSQYPRFSHRIPFYRLTGEEREGVPRGSFELDPASFPLNVEEMPLPEEMKLGMATGHSSISGSGLQGKNPGVVVKEKESGLKNDQTNIRDNHQSASNDVEEHLKTEASTMEACELPEPEFFNFDAIRDLDRFQNGQVWALYSDTDGLPKYYGQIMKVDQDSSTKLRIAWLEAISPQNDMIMWRNKNMPVCCGKFKIKNRKLQSYLDSSPFSHQLQAEALKSNVFEIYPQKGEIWAVYKNWNVNMTPSDLENCDYDFVEILAASTKGSCTKVSVLEQVPGYNSVFRAKMSRSSMSTMEIPHNELLRFSHQIPAHDLTEEKDGSLRGFKELDPSALPPSFFLPKVSTQGLQ